MFEKFKKIVNKNINRAVEDASDLKFFFDEYRAHRKTVKAERFWDDVDDLIEAEREEIIKDFSNDEDEVFYWDTTCCSKISDCGSCDECYDCENCGCCKGVGCCGNCEECHCKKDELVKFYTLLKNRTSDFAGVLKTVTGNIKDELVKLKEKNLEEYEEYTEDEAEEQLNEESFDEFVDKIVELFFKVNKKETETTEEALEDIAEDVLSDETDEVIEEVETTPEVDVVEVEEVFVPFTSTIKKILQDNGVSISANKLKELANEYGVNLQKVSNRFVIAEKDINDFVDNVIKGLK